MNLSVCVWRHRPLPAVPKVFLSPKLSQYPRSWHAPSALLADRYMPPKGAASLTARKSAEKAYDILNNRFTDRVTSKALQNFNIQAPGRVLSSILFTSYNRMLGRWSPDRIKELIIPLSLDRTQALMQKYEKQGNSDRAETCKTAIGDLEMLSREPALASEAVYLCAHRLWNCEDLKSVGSGIDVLPLAKWMLTLALDMGNLKAALDLAHVANLNPDGVIPPAALKEIRAAAIQRTDSRAMAVYARYLLNLRNAADESTRKVALELALGLESISEPADPSTAIRLTTTAFYKWEAPWTLVRDAARQRLEIDYPSPTDPEHKRINQVFVAALRDGVNLYNNPEAARDLSDHPEVEEHSPEWVALKTISAMDGDSNSCYDLARHHIEYWGWYPCIGKRPSSSPGARIGLDWLELSAEGYHENANEMHHRYLILALLLRENGMHEEGREAVKRGIDVIDKYCNDTKWRTWAVKKLQEFDRSWDFPFSARVEALLGNDATPKLPPEQRHKDLAGSKRGALMSWFR